MLFLLPLSCGPDTQALSCELDLPVSNPEFYEGCTIPIALNVQGAETIRLSIDHEDMGEVLISPQLNYWDTEGYSTGEHQIKVICTSASGESVSDEQTITLLPICVDCPEEVSDVEGNLYPVLQIGNQCWMGENLKTRHYADGTPLKDGNGPLGDSLYSLTYTRLPEALTGWYFSYEGKPEYAAKYGYLYTWATVVNGTEPARDSSGFIQGIAPRGWHIPEVEEWRELIDYLGGVEIAGRRLKEEGFQALPGGCCLFNGSYLDEGKSAYFWTATPTIVNHAYHILLFGYDSRANVLGHQDSKRFGYSLRCLMN